MDATNLDDYANLVGNAKPSESGVYFEKGIYPMIYLDRLFPKKSDKTGDALVIAEFDILESQVDSRKPGTQVSEIFNLTGKAKQVHPGKLRALVAALKGKEFNDVGPADIKDALGTAQPLHGRLVRAVCAPRAGKVNEKTGDEYTNTEYTAIPEDVQALASDLRVAAGFPAM